ncbi:RNA recognition motif domain-containing protein [Ditylenchus destructor]|nr:RNA recognition motif domain-containing protein [Ditylenchus destructor]
MLNNISAKDGKLADEKFLSSANLRQFISQIYTFRSFSNSSGSGRFDQSERDSRTVMIGGLSKITTEDSLRQYFRKKSWNATNCRIARDKMTGASLKYGFAEFPTVDEAELASKARHFIDCKVVNVKMTGGKEFVDKYRIFVGGLLKETSKETLHEHFSKFGDVFACTIHYDEDNLSHGFGFVTYKSQDSVDRALNSQPHTIDNKVVFVKHATIRPRDLTMFVGNLSPKTTVESLREYFSKYGQLTQCDMIIDRQTGQSRGFGYVAFGSQEELERARSAHPHIIDGVKVTFHIKGQNLVVDSLSPNITEDSLQKFFSQYGQVQEYRITKNSVGRNTGFVIMSNEDETARALADRPHRISGKLVFTHLKGEDLTLLLYDLPSNTTDKDLYETFSKFGKLVHWQVKRHLKLNSNFPTINGYVSFSSAEEEKFLSSANLRQLISQIYSRQNFSSSSGSGRLDQSERDSRTVMIGGLSKITTEDSLRQYFRKKSWNATNCRIARDKMTGASLKYGFAEFPTVEEAELASKARHFIDCKVVNVRMKGGKELDDKYRIFVGGLSKETSQETLHDHFSQFGDVFACVIHYNEDNLSRGFGSVTYKSQDSVDRALNSQPYSIDNKVVDVKHAIIRPRDLTMFVGNLSPQTTDESLREYFSKYGQLSECYVKIDPKTGQSRGFGYVSFGSKEDLERARSEYPHTIDGVKVTFHSKGQNLVVDSLSPNITKDSLQKFFSQYGQVQDCRMITNSAGSTTAFVTMSSEEELSRALADRPHRISGKLVSTHQKGEEFTLLLYDLPNNTTDKDLYETFSKFGKLVHWQMLRNRKLNANFPTINGYVSFSSAEEVDRVMDRHHTINGSLITIQRNISNNGLPYGHGLTELLIMPVCSPDPPQSSRRVICQTISLGEQSTKPLEAKKTCLDIRNATTELATTP